MLNRNFTWKCIALWSHKTHMIKLFDTRLKNEMLCWSIRQKFVNTPFVSYFVSHLRFAVAFQSRWCKEISVIISWKFRISKVLKSTFVMLLFESCSGTMPLFNDCMISLWAFTESFIQLSIYLFYGSNLCQPFAFSPTGSQNFSLLASMFFFVFVNFVFVEVFIVLQITKVT